MSSIFPPPGPKLPPFRTLLVKGNYHPSAPIHLCISHLLEQPSRSALLLSPSRENLGETLADFNDLWLYKHGAEGKTIDASSRVKVLYPPTAAHLALFLSSLHIDEPTEDNRGMGHARLPASPSLIVLHELSLYAATDPLGNRPTLSMYLSLVTQALATSTFLSTSRAHDGDRSSVILALFDSGLDHLRMPVLRMPATYEYANNKDTEESLGSRRHNVALVVQHYFERVITVEKDEDIGGSVDETTGDYVQSYRALLASPTQEEACEEVLWAWSQATYKRHDDRKQTDIRWS